MLKSHAMDFHEDTAHACVKIVLGLLGIPPNPRKIGTYFSDIKRIYM